MGERYWITGVQIGMIKAFAQMNDPDKDQDIDNILDKVIENQFIGNTNDLKVPESVIHSPDSHQANVMPEQKGESPSKRDDVHSQLKDSDKKIEKAFYHTDALTQENEGESK